MLTQVDADKMLATPKFVIDKEKTLYYLSS